MVLTFLKFYLAINVLLILAYLLFKLTRHFVETLKLPFSYLSLNRVAQMMVLTAILSPILFGLLPRKSVPYFKINLRVPLAETMTSAVVAMRPQAHLIQTSQVQMTSHVLSGRNPIAIENYLLAVLAFGFLLLFVRLIQNFVRLHTLLVESVLVRRIGKVRILVSDVTLIPFSTLVRAKADVVLPSRVVSKGRDLRIIIQHELHHHRNGDTLWVLFMEILECCFFLNPFIYGWKREIAEVQEFACDEVLISQMRVSARDYGQCLVKIAEEALGFSSVQVGTTCMGVGPKGPQQLKSFLRRRIEVFQDHQNIRRKSLIGLLTGAMGLLITAGVAYGAQKSLRSEETGQPNSGIAQFDPAVQKVTEGILKKYVSKFSAKGGFVLVADSQTGRLLAVANQISDTAKNSKTWALSYEMEPASIMKGLIAASAMDRKVIKADEKLNCENGVYNYGGRIYRDWKAFGTLTTTESISISSNICGIKIGEKLGAAGLEASLKDFGFGPNGTAVSFPEAMPGHYPKVGELSETDYVPLISTGYTANPGFKVTPLEVLQAYGAIANDGKLMKPLLVNEKSSGVVLKQSISASTSQEIKAMLVDVVKNGTGQNARSSIYTTAGKTSTAYRPDSPEHETLGGEHGIAGFVGFAPVQNSRLVVYVGIIDPTNSKDKNPHGSEHAAPVFKEVVETVLLQMKVAPDNKATI